MVTFAPQFGVPSGNIASLLLIFILSVGRFPIASLICDWAAGRFCDSPFFKMNEVALGAPSTQYWIALSLVVASRLTISGCPLAACGVPDVADDCGLGV